MYDKRHMVSSAPNKIIQQHLLVYAQNHTGLQVQNLRFPVILNIFFERTVQLVPLPAAPCLLKEVPGNFQGVFRC
jgi:hypothetical protein